MSYDYKNLYIFGWEEKQLKIYFILFSWRESEKMTSKNKNSKSYFLFNVLLNLNF